MKRRKWTSQEKLAIVLEGLRARREAGNRVAPEIIRRIASSKDKRLRALYDGERGLPFTPTELL